VTRSSEFTFSRYSHEHETTALTTRALT